MSNYVAERIKTSLCCQSAGPLGFSLAPASLFDCIAGKADFCFTALLLYSEFHPQPTKQTSKAIPITNKMSCFWWLGIFIDTYYSAQCPVQPLNHISLAFLPRSSWLWLRSAAHFFCLGWVRHAWVASAVGESKLNQKLIARAILFAR